MNQDETDYLKERIEELKKQIEESRERGRVFHQQLTSTYGVIGAITFGTLVFILQDSAKFTTTSITRLLTPHQNFMFLVLLLSLVSMLSIFAALATGFAAAGLVEMLGPVGKLGYISGGLAAMGLIIALMIIVGAVSRVGGDIFFIIFLGIAIAFLAAFTKEFLARR